MQLRDHNCCLSTHLWRLFPCVFPGLRKMVLLTTFLLPNSTKKGKMVINVNNIHYSDYLYPSFIIYIYTILVFNSIKQNYYTNERKKYYLNMNKTFCCTCYKCLGWTAKDTHGSGDQILWRRVAIVRSWKLLWSYIFDVENRTRF